MYEIDSLDVALCESKEFVVYVHRMVDAPAPVILRRHLEQELTL